MNYTYFPGLLGYGLKGKDGSNGVSGSAVYFTDYDMVSDQTVVANAIANNYVLWSLAAPNTVLPGGRSYQNSEVIIDNSGKVYIINTAAIGLYSYKNTLKSDNLFTSVGYTSYDSDPYLRFFNICLYNNTTKDNYLVDNIHTISPIDYTASPYNIYGIRSKDFTRIEYTNVLNVSDNINAYTVYSSGESVGNDDHKSLAIIRNLSTNTFHIGNDTYDQTYPTAIRFDVIKLIKSDTLIEKDTSLGVVISNRDISVNNALFNPIFNSNPASFYMASEDSNQITIEWDIRDFTADPCISAEIWFFENSTGFCNQPYIFTNIDTSSLIKIDDLNENYYSSYIKIIRNGWSRTSTIRTCYSMP
jgi:hypothetical protein